MVEQRMRSFITKLLDPIFAFAVENESTPGTPDVCTVAGWLELKVASWPKKAGTRVMIDLRKTQRIWLRRWCKHGGRAWTLTHIEGEWFLHDGRWSCDHLGRATEMELREAAIGIFGGRPQQGALIRAMLRWKENYDGGTAERLSRTGSGSSEIKEA